MTVTANTTDEQLDANVDAARRTLARQLEDASNRAEDLTRYVTSLAEHEGEREARWTYRQALQIGGTHDTAMAALLDHLTNGSDDAWSGRTNDVRRARFDGFRAAVKELKWQGATA